jgi:predicted RNA binding protein YcfA (HicA-like mRNA interferase family)
MPYQWGVYTTAYARDALHTLIEKIGYENFLYCDTDSVFYRDCPEARQAIEEYNAGIRARSIAAGAYVDDDNILGIATDEGHIKRFKALHAKCYAYEDDQDQLHVTIAGVPKKSIKWIDGMPVEKTNAQELGSLENLEDGFTFKHNGGSRVIYLEDEPRIETINGHVTELASAAIIQDIEKTISDTMYTVGENYELLHVDFVQTAE